MKFKTLLSIISITSILLCCSSVYSQITPPYQDTFLIATNQDLFDGSAPIADINMQLKNVDANDLIIIQSGANPRGNLTIRNINENITAELLNWPVIIENDQSAIHNLEFNDLNWSFQLKFQNVKHATLYAQSVDASKYGIILNGANNTSTHDVGLSISEDCDFLSIKGIEVAYTSVSGIKTDYPICADSSSYNASFNDDRALMEHISITDCYIHHTGNEGAYIGHTTYYYPDSSGRYCWNMKDVEIRNCTFSYIAWDAIQVSSEIGTSIIADNIISNYGYGIPSQNIAPNFDHGNGIQLGDGGCAHIYNNRIENGYAHGIVDFGRHNTSIYNNLIINAGISYSGSWNVNGITIYNEDLEPTAANYLQIYHNTIVNPRSHSVYYVAENHIAPNVFCNNLIQYPQLSNIAVQDNPGDILDSIGSTNVLFHHCSEIHFTDSINGTYTLAPLSIAIDSGINMDGTTTTNPALQFDLNNTARPLASGYDIGAYEASTATQNLSLEKGWSLISTYIQPVHPNIDSIFSSSLYLNNEIIKDENGNVYWPYFGINNIGNIINGKAYLVKSGANKTLAISGNAILPESFTFNLSVGWNYVGYLGNSIIDIESASAGMNLSAQQEMIKNHKGHIYWPYYSINGIVTMKPGFGYLINVASSRSFKYPPNP